jgi:hypothetical protein
MFKLFRLPYRLLKLALFGVLVAYVLMMFPTWAGDLSVSKVVHVVQNGMERLLEQIGKRKE